MAHVVLQGITRCFEDARRPRGEEAAPKAGFRGVEISLTVPEGAFCVLVGPSGCGKSTTLRIIAGLEAPTSGTVRIGDRDVTRVPPADRDVAMVFQSYALYPHMTVRDNLSFGLRMRHTAPAEIARRVDEAASRLGLEQLLDRRPAQLSGGQRQRVAMGRALVRRPAVFLFDEPLSNLDARLRLEVRQDLARLHRKLATTAIYVTHDQAEAMTLADLLVVMKDGRAIQTGTPLEIYDQPKARFVAEFLGTPPMSFVSPKALSRPPIVGEREVDIGIRPEDVSLRRPGEDAIEIPASAELCERLGGETILTLATAGGRLAARLTRDEEVPDAGQPVTAYVDAKRLHLFEPSSGARIAVERRQA